MSQYIHFTEEQKDAARQTDLVELLRGQGEQLKRSGKEYQWRDGSDKVTVRGNLWYHQYDEVGGDAIEFVRRFYNKSYPEAVEYLLGGNYGKIIAPTPVQKKNKEFELPAKNDNMRRAFAYLLNKRGIDRDILYSFVHNKMIYESAKYHNVVFVGYDKDVTPRHANMRGTGSESTFKGNAPNSTPEYSFHWNGTSKYLCLFEAPIDLLSFISMNKNNWQRHSYAASCGVADRVLFQLLKDNPNIQHVYLCFDNDGPGQTAAKRINDKLLAQGISSQILVPNHKDWNEDLLFQEESEVETPCQISQV